MTEAEATTDPNAHQLRCMELWGGAGDVEHRACVPGVTVHVRSIPHEGSNRGGDLHYVTTCGAQRISRFALWDVAGHGAGVAGFSAALRGVLRKHINTPDQSSLMRALNHEMSAGAEHTRFATGMLATYFVPAGHLIVSNAGHPPPMWYRADRGAWTALTPEVSEIGDRPADRPGAIRDLPLGVIDGTEYAQFAVPFCRGDLVLMYTDAVIECASPDGQMFGVDGFGAWLNGFEPDPATLVDRVIASLREHNRREQLGDDLTVMLLQMTGAAGAPVSLAERVRVLGRLLGFDRVETLAGHEEIASLRGPARGGAPGSASG